MEIILDQFHEENPIINKHEYSKINMNIIYK